MKHVTSDFKEGEDVVEAVDLKLFADKVTACWIGKSQGGGLGTPYEGGAVPAEPYGERAVSGSRAE